MRASGSARRPAQPGNETAPHARTGRPGKVRRLALLAVAALAAVGAWLAVRRAPPSPPPMRVSLWYWHRPFKVERSDAIALQAAGVRTLFVRAGTLRLQGSQLVTALPQQWESRGEGFGVHLVFNPSYDVVRAFASLDSGQLASQLVRLVRRERDRATAAGVRVEGLQVDFDCPTRLLPKYADLLSRMRPQLRTPGTVLSITALPTWLTSRSVERVMDQADFAVPQFYEPEVPRTLDHFATVSRLSMFERGLRAAGRTGRPFWAGIPAYGHALVYDAHGNLLGPFHDMGVREASRDAAFRILAAYPADAHGKPAQPAVWNGEEIVDLVADTPATYPRERGWRLIYDLPTAELVRQHLDVLRRERPANCQGAVLFRYPEPGESQTLPIATLVAAIRGTAPSPAISTAWSGSRSPWEWIETGQTSTPAPVDLALTLANRGTGSTSVRPAAVTVTVCVDPPGVEEVDGHGFDTQDAYRLEASPEADPPASALAPASLRRANVLRFTRLGLAAGERIRVGPVRIRARPGERVWGWWSVVLPGGYATAHGAIEPTSVAELLRRQSVR